MNIKIINSIKRILLNRIKYILKDIILWHWQNKNLDHCFSIILILQPNFSTKNLLQFPHCLTGQKSSYKKKPLIYLLYTYFYCVNKVNKKTCWWKFENI